MIKEIINYLPVNLAKIIKGVDQSLSEQIIEIRLRVNQPLQIITINDQYFLTADGNKSFRIDNSYLVKKNDLDRAFFILTENSIYALERQLVEGFITIPGGHRVGFTGQAIIENRKIKTITNVNSLNYRISREQIGIADKIIARIYNQSDDYIYNTLIISPPLCGKTTLLRDLIRIISQGFPEISLTGKKVGVVDERSEIAGAYNGIAQNRIGSRTDLLDNCPKSLGMLILIRSMSPEVIAVDEIGQAEDIAAIYQAVNSGVSLLTTIHGNSLDSLKSRPEIKKLLASNIYQRFIILSKKKGVGTIDKIIDHQGREVF